MNKMLLTAEQESRLYAMLMHYFPDDVLLSTVSEEGTVLFKSHHEDDGSPYVKINWFELCVTFLAHKIIFESDKPGYFCQDKYSRFTDNIMRVFTNNDKQTHPVDFLYNEFGKHFRHIE